MLGAAALLLDIWPLSMLNGPPQEVPLGLAALNSQFGKVGTTAELNLGDT